MAGIDRIGSPAKTQRKGNDWVYGTGSDGDVTISGTVTLTSDKYYNNLTVPLGNVLLTNGFRVFVKNTATINGVVGMGTVTGNSNGSTNGTITSPSSISATGTLHGGGGVVSQIPPTVFYRIGGDGGGSTNPSITLLPSYLAKRIEAMTGCFIDYSYGQPIILYEEPGDYREHRAQGRPLYGGSDGTTGSSGTTTPAKTNSDTWTGKTGGAGNNGQYSPNASTVNAPGGKGNTGYPGTATGATNGTGGAGGAGGAGGGVVAIIAKTITGTGTIMSLGLIGSTGSAGSTGSGGTAGAGPTAYTSTTQRGTSGVDLNDGHQAPRMQHTNHHHVNPHHHTNHHYVTNHHYPVHSHHYHGGVHHSCNDVHDVCHGAYYHSHCCCTHACCTPGHHHVDGGHHHVNGGHHHVNGGHHHTQGADSIYDGGTGGTGGAAAPAVTGGTGKRGGAGGGGAIIVITESTPSSINYDVRAGTTADSDTYSATSGTAYVILNA